MPGPEPGGLVLFVASVPRTGTDELDNPGLSATGRLVGFFGGGWYQAGVWQRAKVAKDAELQADESRRLPADQIRIANEVTEVADAWGMAVTVIDVNHPIGWEDVIRSSVGSDETLPVLLAADGSRLVGTESFGPDSLRMFVLNANRSRAPTTR